MGRRGYNTIMKTIKQITKDTTTIKRLKKELLTELSELNKKEGL